MKPQLHASNHFVSRMAMECVANLECCWTMHLFHFGFEECLLSKFSASILDDGRWGDRGDSLICCVSPHVVAGHHRRAVRDKRNTLPVRVACGRLCIDAAEYNISIVQVAFRGRYFIHEFQRASQPHQILHVWLLMQETFWSTSHSRWL